MICKFSIKLGGAGDGDINLGVDGGIFVFVEGKDMNSGKKYEFFPSKVDFGEFRIPSHVEENDDDEQDKSNARNTDSQPDKIAPADKERDDYNIPKNTDSITLEDEYLKGAEETDYNTIPKNTDSISIDDQYLESTEEEANRNESHNKISLGHTNVSVPVGSDIEKNNPNTDLGNIEIAFKCDENTNGYRFLHLPKMFTKFIECHNGVFHRRDCPHDSLFFVALQCCINYAKFPCRQNCAD